MCAVQVSPEWYTAAYENLAAIERNSADYECPEEGDKAPAPEVFEAVRAFFNVLRRGGEKLEQPKMFVSSNGHILLSYGNDSRSLDVRFDPATSFFFKHLEKGPATGSDVAGAVELVNTYFRV
jgi:hypothetical protein